MGVSDSHHRSIRIGIIFIFGALLSSAYSDPSAKLNPTQERPPARQWQPNQASFDEDYVGTSKCIQCHADKVGQQTTAMAKALELADGCQILRANARLTFRQAPYSYRIAREGDRRVYSVSDGANTISAPILYCFGQGAAGQTYVFEHNGALYESRVSFYKAIRGLDITLGHARGVPKSLDEAAGNRMTPADARSCFGCHSAAAANKTQLRLDRLIPGVSCESCHGPGEKHVAAFTAGAAGDLKDKRIFNPAVLDTEGQSNFCGACHRTWEDVAQMILERRQNNQELGINSVRFQPYRIANSPCYAPAVMDDRRISCTACHDPHKDVEHKPAFYDAKCAACHNTTTKAGQTEGRKLKTCPVGKQNCVTCHMPKYDLPGSHFKFTDHHIRVVRPNESVW